MLDKIVGTIVIIVSLISLSICLFITANANLDLKEFTTSLGSLSLNILFGLLLLKSFYYMLPKENILKPYAKYIVVYQREIGMLVFLFVLPHVIYQLLNLNLFHESKIFLTGLIPIVFLLTMYITSFKKVQLHILGWKKYHSAIWLMIPLIAIHEGIASDELFKTLLILSGTSLFLIAEYKLQKKRAKRHIKYVLYGCMIIVIIMI